MSLPPISDALRLVIWVLVGVATGINVFLGKVYEENLVYFFHTLTKKKYKGDLPEHLPLLAKLLSVTFFLVMIVGTGYASSAPREEDLFVAQSLSTSVPTPEATAEATATSELVEALAPVEEIAAENADSRAGLDPLALLSEWAIPIATAGDTEGSEENNPIYFPSMAAFSAGSEGEPSLVASALSDGSLALFSLDQNFELVPRGSLVEGANTARTNELLFLPGGQLLVMASASGQLSVWFYSEEGLSPSPRRTLEQEAGINALAMSADGETLASGLAHAQTSSEMDDSLIKFNAPFADDLHPRFTVLNSNQSGILDLSFALDGTLITVGNSLQIKWFNLSENGGMVFGGEMRTGSDHHSLVVASPRDPDLFYLDGAGKVQLGSLDEKQILLTSANLVGNPTAMAFHPSLDLLAVGTSECMAYLLDAQTLATLAHSETLCQGSTSGDTQDIGSVSFAPDGHLLMVSTARRLLVLNTYTREVVPEEAPALGAAVDPLTLPLLASLSEWNWQSQGGTSTGSNSSVAAFSNASGEGLIAAGFPDNRLGLFQVNETHQLIEIGDLVAGSSTQTTNALQFMPEAQLLIQASQSGDLSVWAYSADGLSGAPIRKIELETGINALALSPDGEAVASGMNHFQGAAQREQSIISLNLPQTSNLAQKYNLMNTNQTSINGLAFARDGTLISVGDSDLIRWYVVSPDGLRLEYAGEMRTGATRHLAVATSLKDVSHFYAGVGGERAGLIDLATETVLNTSPALGGEVTSLALHPELDLLAVGTANCVVYLLDSGTMGILATSADLCSDTESSANQSIGSLAFSADGDYLLAGNSAGITLLNTAEELLTNP